MCLDYMYREQISLVKYALKIYLEQTSLEQMSLEQMSLEQMSLDQMSLPQKLFIKMPCFCFGNVNRLRESEACTIKTLRIL
jgi:hypothetical protein